MEDVEILNILNSTDGIPTLLVLMVSPTLLTMLVMVIIKTEHPGQYRWYPTSPRYWMNILYSNGCYSTSIMNTLQYTDDTLAHSADDTQCWTSSTILHRRSPWFFPGVISDLSAVSETATGRSWKPSSGKILQQQLITTMFADGVSTARKEVFWHSNFPLKLLPRN